MSEYVFACYDGGKHQWIPQGDGYRKWTSTGTNSLEPPPNAPFFERMRCAKCGATHFQETEGRP